MDKLTKQYRKYEFKQVSTEYNEYKPKIKIIKPDGETKWMDIEESELQAIIKILTNNN